MSAAMEMPKYKCIKEVWALKIKDVEYLPYESSALIHFEDWRYAPKKVDAFVWWEQKAKWNKTGYYVVYSDGYESWSPVEVFEKGYVLL
jgi:hypothetical protein